MRSKLLKEEKDLLKNPSLRPTIKIPVKPLTFPLSVYPVSSRNSLEFPQSIELIPLRSYSGLGKELLQAQNVCSDMCEIDILLVDDVDYNLIPLHCMLTESFKIKCLSLLLGKEALDLY